MSQSFISTARRKERIIALLSWLLQIALRDGGQSLKPGVTNHLDSDKSLESDSEHVVFLLFTLH